MSLRNKILIALGVFVVIGAAFGLGMLIADDDGDNDRASSSEESTTTTEAGDDGEDGDETTTTSTTSPLTPAEADAEIDPELTGPAAELDAAIARAAELSFHARYEGTATAEAGVPVAYVIEIFRRSPEFRRDTTISSEQGTIDVREYLVGGDQTVCFDQNQTGTFTCQDPPEGQQITPQQVAFGTIDPSNGTVTADGACFTVTSDDGVAKTICFDENGVPVLVDDGSLRLEATTVELEVADDAFALPA